MDRFFILIATIILSLTPLKAVSQTGYSVLNRLQGKEWVLLFNNTSKNRVYTQTEGFIYVDGKYDTKAEYYLSDTIETVFNKNKVGKIKNGKYIVEGDILRKSDRDQRPLVEVHEIKVFNESRLVLRFRHNGVMYTR